SDDAEWLRHGVVQYAGAIERNHAALDLVGEAAEIIQPVLHDAGLRAHLGEQLAVLLGLERGDLFGVLRDQVAPTHHQAPAPGRRQFAPGSFERRVGGANGDVHISRAGFDELTEGLARRRIDRLEGRAIAALLIPSVDVVGVTPSRLGSGRIGSVGHASLPGDLEICRDGTAKWAKWLRPVNRAALSLRRWGLGLEKLG